MHAGFGHHQACNGSGVSYGADHFNSPDNRLRWVQFTGTAQVVEPTTEELELFGPGPHFVDGEVFDPIRMRIEPQFITVHSLAGNGNPDRLYQPAL